MRIGELAQLSGLSATRIRFYEKTGLIRAADRRANGYRDYAPETVSILGIIASAQNAGFSLDQVRHLLPLGTGAWDHEGLLNALKQRMAEIEALRKRLEESKGQLLVAIDSIENRPQDLSCNDRTEWVLGRLRQSGVVSIPDAGSSDALDHRSKKARGRRKDMDR